MSKVIIIGSLGILGQQLVKVFKEERPLALDREDLDITKEKAVKELIGREKPKVVINAAAFNDVDGCEDPEKYKVAEIVNSQAPGYLAQACEEINAKLIHYSSDYVFGGGKLEGYKEEEKPQPINAYGQTKFAGEKTVQENCQRYYLIRTTRIFGPTAKSPGAKKSFIDVMLNKAAENDIIKVVNDERAKPTYACDLAKQTKFIIDNQQPFGIYHVTNHGSCTWYEFAQEIFKIMGQEVKIIPIKAKEFPRPAKRPKSSLLINSKLPPLRPWQEALSDFLNNYYLKNQIQMTKSPPAKAFIEGRRAGK